MCNPYCAGAWAECRYVIGVILIVQVRGVCAGT